MNLKDIKKIMENTEVEPIDEGIRFSVLVPLIEIKGELNLIYEVRSGFIRQPCEVSFPGGKIEGNESSQQAAVRETNEELGINESNIEIISGLNYTTNKGGAFVYTFLGYIKNTEAAKINFSRDEVHELFFVPLSYFLKNEPEKYFMNYYPKAEDDFPYQMINNGKNYDWGKIRYPVYFYKYKNYIIWGLTARITCSFINKIKK
mgnify:CR=1 FL=1|jgi:8-oxo-dGTP pyrophosphatase MutT (NUDIX family)